jgi:hypothetical protein
MFGATKAQRLFFFNVGLVMWIGNYMTGFDQVHWVSYLMPGFLWLAALTGFCPGMLVSNWIFRQRD